MTNGRPNTPATVPPDPIDELYGKNDQRRNTLLARGVRVDVTELLLGVIVEELGDEARLKYAERLAGVLDQIEEQQSRMALLRP